jgi:DNA topoisomerase-1
MLKIAFKPEGGKYTAEEAAVFTLEDIKKMIETQVPDAFVKKAVKKAAPKKAASKKAAPKKAAKAK